MENQSTATNPLPNTSTTPSMTPPVTEQPAERHIYRMVIVTFLVVLIGVVIFLALRKNVFFGSNQNKQKITTVRGSSVKKTEVKPTIKTVTSQKAFLKLTTDSGSSTFKVGDTITVVINGTSDNRDISGLDVLFPLDDTLYEVTDVKSAHDSFEMFKFNKSDHMTITSLKKISVKTPTIFTNTPLIKVTIKPKKSGLITIALISKLNKEQTKFVDDKVQIIVPQLQSIQLDIK